MGPYAWTASQVSRLSESESELIDDGTMNRVDEYRQEEARLTTCCTWQGLTRLNPLGRFQRSHVCLDEHTCLKEELQATGLLLVVSMRALNWGGNCTPYCRYPPVYRNSYLFPQVNEVRSFRAGDGTDSVLTVSTDCTYLAIHPPGLTLPGLPAERGRII